MCCIQIDQSEGWNLNSSGNIVMSTNTSAPFQTKLTSVQKNKTLELVLSSGTHNKVPAGIGSQRLRPFEKNQMICNQHAWLIKMLDLTTLG
jgi:hypothetical protein